MQEHRKNMRDLTDLKYNYEKELSDKLALRKNEFDQAISQDFRDQFDKDANEIEDIEDFVAKYGFDYTQFTPSEIYLTDEYKTAFDEYAKTREAE